ncbi:hypothetical protein CBM2587_A170158 [Cupriavidus taiwanensis]|uniref:Uncharacterized protein n=1 Tax=Cupriavidus taiwanensis TaxID=164546 RepID=A0A976A038_9BURK|nr:hypothetical protein CBM2587_A170158 [Cupriavidus taiwanensis]
MALCRAALRRIIKRPFTRSLSMASIGCDAGSPVWHPWKARLRPPFVLLPVFGPFS